MTDEWRENWVPVVLQLAKTLSGAELNPAGLVDSLVWPAEPPEDEVARKVRRRDNFYRHPEDDPAVRIRVGSIHSVKGETHTAILVLDTFFYGHHFRALRPWLCGDKEGQGNEGPRMLSRLKQHYVAFTRPTHLLCIAMRDDLTPEEIQALRNRAWRVGRVQNGGGIEWL